MASLFRSAAASSSSRLPTTCSSLGPSLRRTMAVQVDNTPIIPTGTTFHVTNPSSRLTKKSRKRQQAVLLREDHSKLGFRGDVVSVNKTYARQLYREDIAAPIVPAGGSPRPTIPLPHAPTIKELLHTPAASAELTAKMPLWEMLRSPEGDKPRMTFTNGLPKGYEIKAILKRREEERIEKLELKRLEDEEEERVALEKLEQDLKRYGLELEQEQEQEEEEERRR
ncbi:hypothetical protein BDY24DRAFT_386405 [Mrakia frigida]|uniref:uncharacterized protein n=1 Tax=Mrakia frigida TaxID=29902 RepID=UPI003FCC1FBF